jgi:hypothetical protein
MLRQEGRPELTKEPRLLLNDNFAGKPEGIHLVIGRRPRAAFGNSTGDQQMLEYTTIGDSAGLGMLVLHDDASREYAYGPALGLPGTFTQSLYDEAKNRGWFVISMKNDWKNRIRCPPLVRRRETREIFGERRDEGRLDGEVPAPPNKLAMALLM